MITDSNFILSERTSAICITADMSIKTRKVVSKKNVVETEHVLLALTRPRDFLVERVGKEILIPFCDPNRGKLNPRELYAFVHVVFA